MDSLLNTISHSPVPAREANINTQAPVSDLSSQKAKQIQSPATSHSGTSEQPIPLHGSSHQDQLKDDYTRTSDTTKSERSLTDSSPQKSIVGDTNVQATSLFGTHSQTLPLVVSTSTFKERGKLSCVSCRILSQVQKSFQMKLQVGMVVQKVHKQV